MGRPVVMSAREFACWNYKTDKPTVAQMNKVTGMCRDGDILHATKVGREWHINCTGEWPELFPEVEEPPAVDPRKAFADVLRAMADIIEEGAAYGGEKSDAA